MTRYIEELVSQQVRRSEMARRKQVESGRQCRSSVITLSRRMGTGALIVARMLADELGWSLWDREILDAMAQDARVSKRVVELFDEKTISEIEIFARGAFGDHEMGGFLYLRHLTRALVAIEKLGNAIILGRGANFVLPDALNVRLDASDSHRIANMMQFEGLSREEARAKLKASDRERANYLNSQFGRHRVRNAHYDLEIWMDSFRPADALRIIRAALDARCAAPDEG